MNNIAVFIDGDNISAVHYQTMIGELKQEGRILIQRVYADFSKQSSSSWQDIIVNNGMEAIQTYRVAKKESTDNALIVDCMDTLYNIKTIQKYVIVSSDSDFSSLATKIRLRGLFCIGVGYQHTSVKLRNNCDKFIVIENVTGVQKPTETNSTSIDVLLKNIFTDQQCMSVDEFNTVSKRVQVKDILKLGYIKVYNDKVYYLLNGDINILEMTLNIMLKSDRDMIHMSYLKDCLLNLDSSFDQRRFGFYKMADFAKMIIHNTQSGLQLTTDNKEQVVVISK
jgi:uncharacterized LabA/DUF88 family protein